jgi:3-mercaptopyruvate sulfurtransferase SseA
MDGTSQDAALLWRVLRYLGHPRPLLLEGGWAGWEAAGGPSELYEGCPLKVASVFEERIDEAYR